MTDFAGFPKQTLTFLRALSKNNDRDWFQSHRDDYERYWLEPARSFVDAAGEQLVKLAPDVNAEPRINGSIFRINRDIRFSSDKRPYKDYLDLWFWEGERRSAVSGFYLRIAPRIIGIGVGAHSFDKDRLTAFRSAVADDETGPPLAKIVASMARKGFVVKGEHYKRVPRGYEPPNAAAERLLRHSALWLGEDEPIPDELHTAAFVRYALSRWRKMAPLHRWLVDTLG